MPYIAIKTFPKDEETKKKVVERINELFLELWGCPTARHHHFCGGIRSRRMGREGANA